jgi:long-subunit acyl-CoA synthetase (AMP-forming)
MFDYFTQLGGIEDVRLGLRWDRTTFANEINRRASFLSQMGTGRKSVIAIAHSNSAHFFADLFAVWTVGATAACLDNTLSDAELQTVVRFAKASALLVDGVAATKNLSIPILELASPDISHNHCLIERF